MKKVLLYCLRSVRSEVEQFLSDDYNIIGYSDSDSHYIHVKEFEYKPFYQPDELYKVDLDYIIICHTNREISEIIAKNVYCKIKVPKVAKQKWTLLHVHFGHNCKALYHDSMERCSA